MSKLIKEVDYKGFSFQIKGEYVENYYDWYEKETSAVHLSYKVYNASGEELSIEEWQYDVIAKKKPTRILFWEFPPKITFKQQVEDGVEDIVYYIKRKIDTLLHEKYMTDNLLDSLK